MTPREIAKRQVEVCGDLCTGEVDCKYCEDRLVDDIFSFADYVLQCAAQIARDEMPSFTVKCNCTGCGIAEVIESRILNIRFERD